MIKTNEVLLKSNDHWLHFAEPKAIISAYNLKDVIPSLSKIEKLIEADKWHAAGFISYEAASAFDPAMQTKSGDGFPYLWFGLYAQPRIVSLPDPANPKEPSLWSPTVDRIAYDSAIDQIKTYIKSGDTYQVNYTVRLNLNNFQNNAWELFLHLTQKQNKHAAYVDTGRYVICSASPELFFLLDGNSITCRPMKGTAQRGRTTLEDIGKSQWLRSSEKNRAENIMIVDMVRNDLGRIAETGSVQVAELFTVERYSTLWQMTSTVTAKTNATIVDIFKALFPCASITGAPKISTMKIINDLENTPRRIYTGSIGTIAPDRKAKFNVAIRTVLFDRNTQSAEYGVGGGIVWDSTSMDEYSEILVKARVLTDEVPDFSLLETILWTPEEGFFLRKKHVERLIDSANFFDYPVSKANIDETLNQIASDFNSPQRIRLLVDNKGIITTECIPYIAEDKTLRVCLANESVNSKDIFLFHKTTHRIIYDEARKKNPSYDDVLLYNEQGELTEFTTGNLVVEKDGILFTPPVSSGLLAGTFRAYLLDMDQVHERVIRIEELKDFTNIYLVNSVRKMVKAVLD